MPNVSTIQSNFSGGEISPLLYGRVDIPRYKESLAVCLNYVPLIQGPITRRPGSSFVFPVKDSTAKTRLIPFEFSTSQSYMLEFGNLYVRFYKNNGIVTLPSKAITAITKANPAVVTSAGHGYSNGDRIVISGVLGMTEVNNREFVLANVAMNTFELSGVDSSGYTAYASAGTVAKIYEVVTTYTTAELFQIQFTQSNDFMYLAHPNHFVQTLTRTSDTNWTIVGLNFVDGPFLPQNATATTLTLSNVSGNGRTLTASAPLFAATDVGRAVRINDGTIWNYVAIRAFTSSTVVTVDINGTFANTNATAAWRMGLYSDTTGHPTSICFHQNRLVMGGSAGNPIRFDGSQSDAFNNFSPTAGDGTVAANLAYSYELAANNLNAIQWMTSDEQGLEIGTTGGEWLVSGATAGSAITALSVSAKKSTSYGSEPVQAVQSGKCSIFLQKGSRKVRELNYYFDVNGFRAADLTQMAEHITSGGITQFAIQKTPQPIVWAVRGDGVLLAMTYERDLDALKVGWSRQIIGGSFSTGNAVVESVAVIPTADGTSQDTYVIVKRTVNGATVRYVEYLTQLFDTTTSQKSAFFVDSGLTYNGTATTTISGLNHLNGQSVSVLADGGVQNNKTVAAGRITLDAAASVVTVGIAYNSDGQKLRTDAGAADGTAMGKTRRTHRVGMMLLNTLGFQLGADFNSLDDIVLNDAESGSYGVAPALFTGVTTQHTTTDYDFDNMICWRQSQPLPGTLQGFYPMQVTQDRS